MKKKAVAPKDLYSRLIKEGDSNCKHHWVMGAGRNTVEGRCKLCGEIRVFISSWYQVNRLTCGKAQEQLG